MKERELLMIKVKLDDSHVIINDNSKSKKIILEKAAEIFYQSSGIPKDVIFHKLYEREKLALHLLVKELPSLMQELKILIILIYR